MIDKGNRRLREWYQLGRIEKVGVGRDVLGTICC